MADPLTQMIAQSLFRINPNLRDLRPNLTPKGTGYFGVLPRPDGGVSTELSAGVDFGQGETLIPLLVPTLERSEVNYLLTKPDKDPVSRPILDKAILHAQQRLSSGLSPFASNEEIPYGIKLSEKSPEWIASQIDLSSTAAAAGLPSFTPNQSDSSARLRLKDAISRSEASGFKVPHFIGTPTEPTGDRGLTMDIENLVKALKLQQQAAVKARNNPGIDKISRELAYWEKEAADGMSAQEWKSQTGELDPVYPQ